MILCMSTVHAESNFINIRLQHKVSIEIPKNWMLFDGSQLTTLDAFVEASGKKLSESSLPFAANLYDADGKTLAIVNVRFYPENPLKQKDCNSLTSGDLVGLDASIKKGQIDVFRELGIDDAVFDKAIRKKKNGLCIIQHAHSFSTPKDGNKIKEVRLRIWASPRGFTVTSSYNIRQEYLLKPIVEYILNSIRQDD